MAQPVVHFEFWSQDPAKVSDFYKKVFDWEIRNIPEMDYSMVEAAGEHGIGGGIMKPKGDTLAGNMTFYIDVDDLDTFGEKVKAAGGKLVIEKMEVPGVGQFTLFEDPDGRQIGMWKQLK